MLSVHKISKSFGVKPILNQISFSVKAGERAALVGENGCGKTTLLRIIAQEIHPDSGRVQYTPASLRIGYLPQGLNFSEHLTIGEYLNKFLGDPDTLAAEIEEHSIALSSGSNGPALLDKYDTALAKLVFAQEHEGSNKEIIRSLGLAEIPPDRLIKEISGGQKTRLALAQVMMNNPDMLLLDEPTNHLDIQMLRWMEDWMVGFQGGVLIVSHDRSFLDKAATSVLEMDKDTQSVKSYAGNYSDYLEQRLAEQEKQWADYKDQQDQIAQLRKAANHVRSQAKFRKGGKADKNITDGFSAGHFANRSLETMRRAKSLEKRLEKLLTEDKIDKPRSSWQMHLEFRNTPSSSQDVLVLEDLSIGYQGKPLLAGINQYIQAGQRVVMIGENGSGKSTLLKTAAGQIPPVAGRVRLGANIKAGYLAQNQDTLSPNLTPVQTIQSLTPMNEGKARSLLHKFLFTTDEAFNRIENLSYGERSRLMLACLVVQECNFLLLDEPFNHLDIPSRIRFEKALASFDGTILAVVHDRYFLQHFAQVIWEIRDGEIHLDYPPGEN